MGYQIKPLQEFLVRPALPPTLSRLPELGYNVLWSWDHRIRSVFRRLDDRLWRASGHNPILMLSQVSRAQLERAGDDPRYLAQYKRACAALDEYLARYQSQKREGLLAYFCMEFGIVQCLPIYSGGLGILAGDHLKAASDLALPLVGVGLLYQKGYFRQSLNQDGWQEERTPVNDFYTSPIRPVEVDGQELYVQVRMPEGEVQIKVWYMAVGGVTLYLLDTNIPENRPEHRPITDQLYGGDIVTRMRQEIVLGIGGLRALTAAGVKPTVFHMNEGHSAFLPLERMRMLMSEHKLSFKEAWEASRRNNVFTTHTSVPAGFDLFDPGMLYEYLGDYCEKAGIPFDTLLQLGRRDRGNNSERFAMAVSALNNSAYRNAVSLLHGDVSREMFQGLWPQYPTDEVPITAVTNGVHLPSWCNGELAQIYEHYLPPDWNDRLEDPEIWTAIADIPDTEIWDLRRRRKRRLVQFVRECVVEAGVRRRANTLEIRRLGEVLDPDVFTIGFARRFATYKRATLLFRDVARLKRLLTNPDMPVQVVIAGKAHPKDHPGKTLIREIWNLSRDPDIARRLVFVEDYSIQVGRELVQGVDLWLNTPRRGEEACGTSGMKAAINGVLNFSVLDGWFDEAYESSGGWAIGGRVPYAEDQDDLHAAAVYSLLENEIVPMYYRDRDRGIPHEWVRRMRASLSNMSPQFNCRRMLTEYWDLLYKPAHYAWEKVSANNFEEARRHVKWTDQVDQAWRNVTFNSVPVLQVADGAPIEIRTTVNLAGLKPRDVRVEAVVGRVGSDGFLETPTVITLSPEGTDSGNHIFSARYEPERTGRVGYALRIAPKDADEQLTRPCLSPLKWA